MEERFRTEEALPRLFGKASLAGRLRVPAVPPLRRVVSVAGKVDLCDLSASDFRHGGNDFSGHPQAFAPVVSSDLVRHQPEKRGQRDERAEDLRAGKLSHRLDMATEASAGDGAT
jgi:hypothetical protein